MPLQYYILKRFRTLEMIVLLVLIFSRTRTQTQYAAYICCIIYALQRCHEGRKQININHRSKQIK